MANNYEKYVVTDYMKSLNANTLQQAINVLERSLSLVNTGVAQLRQAIRSDTNASFKDDFFNLQKAKNPFYFRRELLESGYKDSAFANQIGGTCSSATSSTVERIYNNYFKNIFFPSRITRSKCNYSSFIGNSYNWNRCI